MPPFSIDHSPVVLLLAAGEGTRYGGIKQLAEIEGEPMVRRVARSLLETRLPLVVVTGAYAEKVEHVLSGLSLQIIRCDDWQRGMGESLATGIRYLVDLYPNATAVLVCLADQPLLNADMLKPLLDRHAAAPDRLLATESGGISSPPALFPRDCFAALMNQSGPHGARGVLAGHASRVEAFVQENMLDVDTPDDLHQVQQWLTMAPPHKKKP